MEYEKLECEKTTLQNLLDQQHFKSSTFTFPAICLLLSILSELFVLFLSTRYSKCISQRIRISVSNKYHHFITIAQSIFERNLVKIIHWTEHTYSFIFFLCFILLIEHFVFCMWQTITNIISTEVFLFWLLFTIVCSYILVKHFGCVLSA